MKLKKINYNFTIDQIIESNLSVQSIQKSLKDNFGILSINITTFKNPNFIKKYTSWDTEKRSKFIKIIGGVVYYNKIKNYLEKITNENGEKI